MTDDRWQEISRLYHRAASLAPAERLAFLDSACGSDNLLREEVESLLVDDSRTERLLEPADPRLDLIGRRIGHYEIQSLIGAGGMGSGDGGGTGVGGMGLPGGEGRGAGGIGTGSPGPARA